MTNINQVLHRCVQAKAALADIARLLLNLITTLENQRANTTINMNTLECCQHNLALVNNAIARLDTLLASTSNAIDVQHQFHTVIKHVIEIGKWQPGKFLQALYQRLQTLENDQESIVELPKLASKNTEQQQRYHSKREGHNNTVMVFVHLYQTTGNTLTTWISQLHNIYKLLQARPIYASKTDMLAVLAARGDLTTDAYVALTLPKQALASAFRGSTQVDKYGYELVSIDKDVCPRQPLIDHFYHDKQHYHLVNDELQLVVSSI